MIGIVTNLTPPEVELNGMIDKLRAEGVEGISFFCWPSPCACSTDYATGAIKHLKEMKNEGIDAVTHEVGY